MEFFLNLVFVAALRVAHHQFAQKSGEKKLGAENHHRQGDVEIWGVGYERVVHSVVHRPEFRCSYNHYGYQSEQKHQRAEQPEEMHRFHSEFVCEPESSEVEIAVDESVEAEFRRAVFAGLMVYNFLAYAVEACVFGQIGYIAVHVAVNLDAFHHLLTVCLQSAVEIVEVMYAAHLAGSGVEELRGDCLGKRVVALLSSRFPRKADVCRI